MLCVLLAKPLIALALDVGRRRSLIEAIAYATLYHPSPTS